MINKVMLMLGPYVFSIDTAAYQSLTRTTNYKWSKQERVNNKSAKQYISEPEDSITLNGVIYPEFSSGLLQLDLLRSLAATGKPQLLVASPTSLQGFSFGYWIIENIQETQTYFLPGGVPRKIEFSLQLSDFGNSNDLVSLAVEQFS
jgi:phage protein U